ncbi:hypothetical protein MMC13_006054 [Lambiella insularis]|nr:hypothetical protein [Lambiella insularis]
MSSAQQSESSTQNTATSYKYSSKGALTSGKNGKFPAQDDENAPLLQGFRERTVDSHNPGSSEEESLSFLQRVNIFLQDVVVWILENLVIVVLSCLLTAGTVAVCVYGLTHHHSAPWDSSPVCTTAGCVLSAAALLHNISPDYSLIDPCDDFRTFVCAGWDEKHDLRDDQSAVWTGTAMGEQSQTLLRHVLESGLPQSLASVMESSHVDKENFVKIQDAYQACMDEPSIGERKSSPLLQILYKLEELFPVNRLSQTPASFSTTEKQGQAQLSHEGDSPLTETMSYMMSIGVGALLWMDIEADDKDPDATIVVIRPPLQPGLPSKEYYKDEKLIESYKATIGQVLEALLHEANPNATLLMKWRGDQLDDPAVSVINEALIDSLVELETKFAEATPDTVDFFDVTKYYNPLSLELVRTMLPQILIPYLISSRTPGFTPDKVLVASSSYLKTLSHVLSASTEETIQAYLVWKTVQGYAVYVESDAVKPLKRFNNELQGKEPDSKEERWRTCVKYADRGLGWMLSRLYIEKAFSKQAKDFGDLIVTDIKSQFIKKLGAAEWMSPDVRQLAINKVHNIVQKIGYPTKSPNIDDPEMIRSFYASVNINRTTFFENTISIAVADVKREWAKAGKPTNRDEWEMTASTVNAYYNPAGNEIVFPAGIMQSPVFYDPTVPQYLSYGAFGAVSGHELSHAFDSTGRHYDQRGNYTQWWDTSTIKAFKDKAQCFVDQYHNYTIPGPDGEPLHVNGLLTLGENIADAGGLSAAFQAWKEREEASPSDHLPGLQDFTKEQLFFMSYATFWCGKTRKESAINRIYTDPHSPFFARVLGTTANSREFRESFHCKEKEPVCELW